MKSIQRLFKSDIRSMINYIQSNQYTVNNKEVVDDNIWDELTALIKHREKYKDSIKQIYKISSDYNIEIKNIIKDYLNYIIHFRQEYVTHSFLKFTEFIMHLSEPQIDHMAKYTVLKLHELFSEWSYSRHEAILGIKLVSA